MTYIVFTFLLPVHVSRLFRIVTVLSHFLSLLLTYLLYYLFTAYGTIILQPYITKIQTFASSFF